MGVITADMSNLDFVHLVQLHLPVPTNSITLPSDDALKADQLRWTFVQSAYLLPLMLLAGPVLIFQLVILVGRLGSKLSLADGLAWTLVLTVGVVGLMMLLTAFVGASVAGVVLTRMVASAVVASALGLVVQAVQLSPPPPSWTTSKGKGAVVGFPTVAFAAIYGLGTAFASSSTLAGYQLAGVLQRYHIGFQGTGSGRREGYRGVFLLEGAFILALCPVIGIFLMLPRRLTPTSTLEAVDEALAEPPIAHASQSDSEPGAHIKAIASSDIAPHTKTETSPFADSPTDADIKHVLPEANIGSTHTAISVDDTKEKDMPEKRVFVSLRRFSSYYTSPFANVAILNRNSSSLQAENPPSAVAASAVASNIRALQQLHTGFGRWVSALLRRIMIFVFGGMGVDDAAFDLISAGTSSRETFICGVLIVSNTVIVQLAVVSLIAPLKAPDEQQTAGTQLKVVPALPGLPTLAGGVSGCISAVVCSLLATTRPDRAAEGKWQRWRSTRWWVPALLTACLVITLVGLGLAVVANTMVPAATCGSWIMYVATGVTYAGSTPQLPLALQQICTVLDSELGCTGSLRPPSTGSATDSQPAETARVASSASVQAIRWERVGAMISTLTTIAGSELLTAWVFLMPDAAQKVFLFTSAVLAIGGAVWLMLRHTKRRIVETALSGVE
ncbi:hypothetical protein EX895_002338 [Sporisorium graminicola]|uniref:Uncharacterized protein n=1 Tax=Sporisorium graminicola TaxID=280036 RepID=A0A4U7KWX7_9BASI|nr:hypothetical protein EX895_002338 [Sporisorium graminicola]TKY88707.1 hypothetical protein EX895_002338 [Sporisorium graminicola]